MIEFKELPKAQSFFSPSGDEMVVMPRADYDRLTALAAEAEEDAADLAIYDERKAALEKGEDEVLPADVTMHVRHGHSLVKAIRFWRNMKQADLAFAAHVSQGFISDLENGKKKADEETLDRIATVLSVPLAWLQRA